jgi:pilus assembly protein CpaB
MNKFLKNKTALGISCIFLALVLSFVISPLISKATKSQKEIVRATKDIRKGEEITEDCIKKVKVGSYNLPGNVIYSKGNVIGKYATTDIYKGDYFLNDKITDLESNCNNYLYSLGNNNELRAVSITLKSSAAALSGKLKEGDIVSIVSNISDDIATIVPELEYVKVLSVTNKEGIDIDDKDNQVGDTITFEVNRLQAEKLVQHEQEGNIHVVLTYRGSESIANKYLKKQTEFNTQKNNGEAKSEDEKTKAKQNKTVKQN